MARDVKSIVRPFFTSTRRNRAKTGQGASVSDLIPAAQGANYLIGRGNQLIPGFRQDIASGSSMPDVGGYTLYTQVFRVAPSYSAIDRYWTFSFASDGSAIIEVSVSGSQQNSSQLFPVSPTQGYSFYREPVNSVTPDISGTQEVRVQFRVSSSTGDGVIPYRWSCFEAPRRTMNPLSSSTEGGVNEASFRMGYPLYDSGQNQYDSVPGIARNVQIARKQSRRAGLFTWSVPLDQSGNEFEDFALETTSSTYEEMIKFPIMTQPTYRNVTSSNVLFMWIARQVDFTAGGTLKLENGLGDSIEYSITGSDGTQLETWYSASLPVPMVDTNHDRGFPTGSAGAPGFVPYVTMSMKVDNQRAAVASSQQFRLWTFQAFDPHEDLEDFSGTYES